MRFTWVSSTRGKMAAAIAVAVAVSAAVLSVVAPVSAAARIAAADPPPVPQGPFLFVKCD